MEATPEGLAAAAAAREALKAKKRSLEVASLALGSGKRLNVPLWSGHPSPAVLMFTNSYSSSLA
jgi:hypothetical protein